MLVGSFRQSYDTRRSSQFNFSALEWGLPICWGPPKQCAKRANKKKAQVVVHVDDLMHSLNYVCRGTLYFSPPYVNLTAPFVRGRKALGSARLLKPTGSDEREQAGVQVAVCTVLSDK